VELPAVVSATSLLGDTEPAFQQSLDVQQSVEQSARSSQPILHNVLPTEHPREDIETDQMDETQSVLQQPLLEQQSAEPATGQ